MGNGKIVTAGEPIALIRQGDAVSCSGFVGIGTPEDLITGKRSTNPRLLNRS